MSIGFNSIPGNIVAPIITFEVNSGGQFESQSRLVLIGHKTDAGTMALDTLTPCQTMREATTLAGKGSILAEMFRLARANAPAQEIWIAAATEVGTAATYSLTVTGVSANGGTGQIWIGGEPVTIETDAGDTAADVATALVDAINNYQDPLTLATLPFTAARAVDVVVLTSRHKGDIFNFFDLHIPALGGGNVLAGRVTITIGVAGSGQPNLSAILAQYGDDAFDWTVSPFADDTNIERYEALLSDVSGRWAWNRQSYGHVFTTEIGSLSAHTTFGLSKDTRHVSFVPQFSSGGLNNTLWGFLAGLVARQIPWLSDGSTGNVSRNQTGLVVEGVRAPRDRALWPTDYATRDALLTSGISTWGVNANGNVTVDKTVTMQRTDGAGNVDTTFRDIQTIGQVMYALRRFRARLQAEHGQKAIANSNPGDLLAITTVKDIANTIVATAAGMPGVLENIREFSGRLEVKRNGDNPNRVDIYAPLDVINPLDVIAANATIYKQYPAAPAA